MSIMFYTHFLCAGNYMKFNNKNNEAGNIMFLILIAIALFGLITAVISTTGQQQKDALNRQTMDSQISVMINHVAALNSAILQTVMHGEDISQLYQNISTLKAGDDGFDTSPHKMKIYHPLGGGISYLSASSNTADESVATNFDINSTSIITGVGRTDLVIGDVLFIAKVISENYCSFINKKLTASKAIPEMDNSSFDDLFNNNTTVLIDNNNCADCVNVGRICVKNTTNDEWGFYATLFPG